jgi:hypothetical protein
MNVRALANQDNPLQSHRAGTGEVRFTSIDVVDSSGVPLRSVLEGGPLTVRAAYAVHAPIRSAVFQVAILDTDTGVIVATATAAPADGLPDPHGSGVVECTFESVPLCPRQYALRLAITDAHQLMSYDVVAAGPRFAVTQPSGRRHPADDDAGVVSLPYRFEHRQLLIADC